MPNNDQIVSDFGECVDEVLVLAVELKNYQIAKFDEQLRMVLNDAVFNEVVKNKIAQYMQSKAIVNASVITVNEFKELAFDVGQTIKKEATDAWKEEMKETEEYKSLVQSLKNLKTSFRENTKLGIFLDENKEFLYIIGTLGVLGGVGSLFHTPKGKALVIDSIQILKDKPQIINIGKYKLGGELLEFEPDSRLFGGKLIAGQKLKSVEKTFSFGMIVEGPQMKSVMGQAVIKYPKFEFDAKLKLEPTNNLASLTLKTKFDGKNFKVSIGAEVYKQDIKLNFDGQYKLNKRSNIGFTGNFSTNSKGKIDSFIMAKFVWTL